VGRDRALSRRLNETKGKTLGPTDERNREKKLQVFEAEIDNAPRKMEIVEGEESVGKTFK